MPPSYGCEHNLRHFTEKPESFAEEIAENKQGSHGPNIPPDRRQA